MDISVYVHLLYTYRSVSIYICENKTHAYESRTMYIYMCKIILICIQKHMRT